MQDIIIGSDHRGFELKQKIKEFLKERKMFYVDCGVPNAERPSDTLAKPPILDVIREVCQCVQGAKHFCGILICANGLGMSIGANRFRGIRATLCQTPAIAKMAREDNDANVLVLAGGGKDGIEPTDFETVKKIVTTFVNTKSLSDARFVKRCQQFDTLG